MKNFAEINRASTGAKKTFNFFEKLWEHSRTLRRVGLVLVMCLITITQMWAYNLERAYLKYNFNGGDDQSFGVTDDNNYTDDKGTLTGSFTLKGIYIISSTGSGDTWTGGKMGYTIYSLSIGGETSEERIEPDDHKGYKYGSNAASERQDQWEGSIDIASNTSNSGIYYFKFYFVSYFGYGNDIPKPGYGNKKEIKYTVLPPSVSSYTVTATGKTSGTGTELDPYIVPYGGTLQLDLSNASQGHTDSHSSIQYSIDNSSWGTETSNTRKVISNITKTTEVQNWVVYAKYHNSADNIDGTTNAKTIYYKAATPTAGTVFYKFKTKTSGLGEGSVCAAASTEYPQTTSNSLSALTGGALSAYGTGSLTQLQFKDDSYKMSGSNNTWLIVKLDCPIASGDVIRYINYGEKTATINVQSTRGTNTTFDLAGSGTKIAQTITIPDAFIGATTLYLTRKAGAAYLTSFEIIRPYTLTLNAHDGSVSPSSLKVPGGEATSVLPHASYTNYWHKGWFASASGGAAVSNPYTATSSTTLHAQYDPCSSKTGSIYKFIVKNTLTAGSPFTAGTVCTILTKGDYLSELYGGTLDAYGRNTYLTNTTSAFTLANTGAYLLVTLDCPLRAGDQIKSIISNKTIYVTKTNSRGNTNELATGTNTITIPANLEGATALYLWQGSGNTAAISHFEIIRPAYSVMTTVSGGVGGTVSAEATSLPQGATTTITAVPADGYQVASWAVSGAGSTISPSGTSSSTTTTLTMGSANATVTVTFEAIVSTYSITYHCNSATSGCPSNAIEQTALPDPLPTGITKNGYTFGGWYTDEDCTVAAVAGDDLSDNADLYAKWTCTTPTFSVQPSDATVCKDASSPSLGVTASANGGSLSYQWYVNTTKTATISNDLKISGATSSTYSAPTGTPGTKYYYCYVTNTTGSCSATSDIATVTVNAPTAISTQPSSIANANVDAEQTLSIAATGTNLGYQWYTCDDDQKTNADDLDGETDATLSITPDEVGVTYYYCVVTGDCGTETSNVVSITAKNAISPTLSYDSYSVLIGGTLTATLDKKGSDGSVTYESSDDAVATVASDGTVTGVSAGTVTITATIAATSDYWSNTVTSSTITVSAPTYTVTYTTTGSTGGTAPTDSDSPYESGSTVTVKGNTGSLVKTDYVFLGWSDGNSNNYAPGETFTISENTTLSPIWKEGTSATITYTMAVGTDNTWSASGSSNETTGIPNAGVTITETYAGIDSGKGHKNGSTAKLAIQTTAQGATYDSPTNYILYNFSVASGYAFTPSDITIKIANVGEKSANNIKYKAVLSDASSHSISTTYICTTQDATIETFHLYNDEGVTFDGNVSLKLWAWKISSTANGSSDSGKTGTAYRLGTPLTIAGVTESTATLYDISTSATNGTITVMVGGESASSAEEDATVTITASPSDGHSFSSWTVTKDAGGDVDVTSSTTSPTTFSMPGENVTVSATFSPNTYDITYHENGASYKAGYTAPATYTVGTGATLPTSSNMTNTGYTFGGWYNNSGLTGSSVTTIGTSEYGNKEYWAKWTENTYTITYDANGGTGTTSSTNGHYVTVATNGFTAPSGKVFVGWNTVSGGGGDSYGEGDEIELTGNMTLYAIWATDYDISWGNAQYGGADETPNLGGGNYTITASVATWAGTLTTDMISAVSDGVTITNVAVDNSASPKTITATFDVGASVAGTTIKMQLDVPAYGVYGAKSSEKSITIDRCSGGVDASTVVFSQNFSSVGAGSVDYAANTAREYKSGGTTITGIVGSGTNEFTYIGQAKKDKCGVAVNSSTGGNSVNATGIFQAYCNNTGGMYALVKNSNFAATAPTALKVSMKIWFQQGSSSSDYSVTFAVGDGFSNSTSAPDATNVHSGFSILNNSNAYLYPYKSNKTALSGTNKLTQGSDLAMVWVINNSGQTLSYTDPASNTSTLANDKFDVWIGTTRFIAGANATTASKALQDLYIGDPAGKYHQLRLDDIVVTDISPAVSSITPTLTWDDGALDIASDGVTKEEGDADFTFTASQNKNSLGAITYSSSNTSVATVNASGKVHIVGNGSTTITATIAESGCYKDADVSYSLTVNEKACSDAAGTIKNNDGSTITDNAITKSSCETVTLKLVGYTDGADIQWYKDGEAIDGATNASYSVPTSGSGVYSAISSKTCDRNSTNEITVTNSASVSATKIVDSWYVKAGRRTPDIALVQTMDAASFQVKISSTVIWSTVSGSEVTTGLGGCGFYLGKDGIIYLKGTKSNGNATDDILENKTLSFVVTNACGANASDPGNITIKRQAATDRPSVAYVSLGTKGGAVTDTTAGYYKTAALYKYLDHTLSDGDFDLTASNVYWSVNEKELKEHYSQFDAILITDDPSTKTVPSGVSGDGAYKTKGYVNALGCLVDIRPILTMEAYVSALANWKTKGINGDPTSPNPRQYSMKLQCKDHEIFGNLSVGDNVVQTTVDGTNYWSVKMVDNTKSPYSGLADDEKTSGKGSIPALQGFAASDVSGLLLLGQISDGAYHAGVERQEEPAARLMLLGLNNQALPNALTQEGKIVIKNALTYLLKTNMEEVDDCSNYFTGATSTDWNTATNWSKGVVPNSPMIRARILAPCEITGITVKAAQIDIVTSGTSSKKAGELTGKLTINPTGALIVGGKIRAAEAPYFSIEDLKPTEEEDLVLNTNSSNQAALIFDNEDGDTKATVNLYSLGRKESGLYYYQYMAVPMESLPVNPSFAGSGIYTYVWNEASGWERRGYYTDLYAFEGVGITTKFADAKTYEMKGTLASTETREIALTNDKNGQNMIGNSWTAPIQIADLEEDNSASEITQTVYIYSTGNGNTVSGGTTASDGQWLAIPFSAAGFEAWDGLKVIPAMQTFNINVTGTSMLTLDYDKVVRKRAAKMSVDTLTTPLHAPKRSAAHEGVELMRIRVEDSQTHTDLYLFKGERFSDEFDNGWEAEYLNGDGRSAKLYAQTEIGKMAVVATDELEGMVLGFEPGKETEYTFTFGGEGMGYYLNDLKLKKSTWINAGETYSFTYEEGDINRFIISTTPITTIMTGCESVGAEAAKVRKVIIDDKVYIIRIGHMYSVDGQMVK